MAKSTWLRRLFLTDDLRPALLWRVAAYALLFGACLSLREPIESFIQPASARLDVGPWHFILQEFAIVVFLISATLAITFVFRRFVDRGPWAGMAIATPWRRWHRVVIGFWLGAAMIVLVLGVEYSLGWFGITGLKEGFGQAAVIAVLSARFVHFVGTAVCEEVAYRGYLLQNVAEQYPLWLAVLITGLVFALSHFPAIGLNWTLIGFVVSGIVVSYFLALMRLLTRGIWLGVGWHLGWDWIEDASGLVPGYSPFETQRAGPPQWVGHGQAIEGGLLIIIVLTIGLAGLLYWCRQTGGVVEWRAKLTAEGAIQRRL